MLRRTCTSLTLALAAAMALAVPATTASAADVVRPIEPKQYFAGLVNDTNEKAVIRVACVGAMGTGRPVAGQYVSVVQQSAVTSAAVGYTGSEAKGVIVDFGYPSFSNQPLRITSYDTPAEIPTNLTVPCSGTGTVQFVPNPTSAEAVTAVVEVTYEGPSAG